MNKAILAALAVLTVAPMASATNYAIFFHGRTQANWGTPLQGGAGSATTIPAGYTAVDDTSWNGTARIDSVIPYAAYAAKCAAPNTCIIYNYSTGGLVTQRLELLTAAKPLHVNSFASAGGGSELASSCGWVTQWGCYYGGVDDNLKPSWARNAGNALQSGGNGSTWHVAGNGWSWLGVATAAIINGDDDGATGPHSNTGCGSTESFGLPTSCTYSCGFMWLKTCGGRKSNHKQWVTGGWTHFNIQPAQKTYWN
jgi:hypothetical protein